MDMKTCDRCQSAEATQQFKDAKAWPNGLGGDFCTHCAISMLRDELVSDLKCAAEDRPRAVAESIEVAHAILAGKSWTARP